MLKKISVISLIILMAFVSVIPMNRESVEAKSIRAFKEELQALREKYEKGEEDKKFTEAEIEKKKQTVSDINDEINTIEVQTQQLTDEIEVLNQNILEKEEEIKKIINYYQISNGESAYLEYIFNAVDFTDFIYRLAIAEQLSTYNDNLIDEYDKMIKENESKKEDLANKKIVLNNKQNDLEKELLSLDTQLGEILEESVTTLEEIESIEETIKTYESFCDLDEDIDACIERYNNSSKLPPGTAFYRPVVKGKVSANYGWYYPWGTKTWHYGMDISQTGHGAPVYAMANGRVSYITRKASCGGNMLYIEHVVDGVNYTTGYFHLATIEVNVGDIVTYNTVVGTVGGNGSIETWDKCSTGTHLHIQFGQGHFDATKSGYYTKFTAKAFNPRTVLNLPSEGSFFYDRETKY